MPTTDQVLGLGAASVLLLVVPGPSVVFIVGRALSYGRRIAVATGVGNSLGAYAAAAIVAVGLGPVLERSELLFSGIKLAGAAVILWLGVVAFRRAGRGPMVADQDAEALPPRSVGRAVGAGLRVGVANPKAFVLYASILPQFVDRTAGLVTGQLLVLALVPASLGAVTDAVWALLAGQARHWLGRRPLRRRAVGRVGGLSLIGVGVSVAFSGRAR